MRNVYRLFWILSIIGLLSAILVTYTQVGDLVYMAFGPQLSAISRDQYFYTSVGVLFLTNFLWFVLSRMFPALPPSFLPVPAKDYWLSNKYRYKKVREILANWMLSIGTVANYWLIVYVLGLMKPNSLDPDITFLPAYYGYLGWFFTATLLLPAIRLTQRKLSVVFQVDDED